MQIAIMVPVVADGVSLGCTMSLYMYSVLGRRLSTDVVSPHLIYVEDWPLVVKYIIFMASKHLLHIGSVIPQL